MCWSPRSRKVVLLFTHCQDVSTLVWQKIFDQVKVAVKRGEIDWLHIIPEGSWCNHDRVITRVVKLCRVARRRGIWFSFGEPKRVASVGLQKIKSLFDEDEMRVVSTQSSNS